MDTKLDNELLLPPLCFGRHDGGPELNNPYIRVISRNFFETREEFFNRIRNAVDDICFSLAEDTINSQELPWWLSNEYE
jgi:hypothetical protein